MRFPPPCADIVTAKFQVFARAPIPGQVKTRLSPPLSADDAVRLYVRMLERAATAVREAVERVPGAAGELWCTPDAGDPVLGRIAAANGLRLRAQPHGDLGDRMRHALGGAVPGRAILIGSDLPVIDAGRLLAAVDALADHEVVIAPSDDGGYGLIGCRDRVPDCFDGIGWSTSAVMRETRHRLDGEGVRWTTIAPVWDVDTGADLVRLAADPQFAPLLEGISVRPETASRCFVV